MKYLLFISLSIIISLNIVAQQVANHVKVENLATNTEYYLWSEIHWDGIDQNGKMTGGIDIEMDEDFIKNLPKPIKQIIALYTAHLKSDDSKDSLLLNALGGYSNNEEMRAKLLDGCNIMLPEVPSYIYAKICQKDSGIIITTEWGEDLYQIDDSDLVHYIGPKMESIPYNYVEMKEEYSFPYNIYLDGKIIDSFWYKVFLDKDNIESINVCERNKSVYIERKNRENELFNLSMIEVSKLNFKVDSISEVRVIEVGAVRGDYESYEEDMIIECSAIRSISSNIVESEDDTKFILINIKN